MATAPGGPTSDLEKDLLQEGHRFSFFQAMRLLTATMRAGGVDPTLKLRVRPHLSLAFPCADVAGIEKSAQGYLMTVTFLGLYGPASPLPTFYTEQLLDEALSELTATRDFLDLINQRIYELLYQGLGKHRLLPQSEEQARYIELLFSLMGLGGQASQGAAGTVPGLVLHAGLLGMRTRSALGLTALLKSALKVPVRVIQCVTRRVTIPPDQQLRIGSGGARLGEAIVGEEVGERTGGFRVRIGPVDLESYRSFLPGGPNRCSLDNLIERYVKAPLVWDVELVMAAGAAPAATLGSLPGGRLGFDSWLAPGHEDAATATFPAPAGY